MVKESGNTKFHDYVLVFQSAAAAPSPVMGNMPPNDAMPGGPMPPGFFQVCRTLAVTFLFTPSSGHLFCSSITDSQETNHFDFTHY